MPTNALAAQNSVLHYSTDGGTTHAAIVEVNSMSISINGATIDVSNWDSGDWDEFIGGRKSGTLSFSGNFIPSATSHQALHNTLIAASASYQLTLPTSPAIIFQFAGVGESLEISGDDGDAFKVSFSVKLSGEPNWAATAWA